MNSLIVFAAVAVCAATALPAFEDFQETGLGYEAFGEDSPITDLGYTAYEDETRSADEFHRNRRSLEETALEDDQLFHEELLRERRSLSEADFEEIPFEEEHGARLKRATCDALSFESKWLTVNHSACAIHCIARGYRGGSCKKTVCHCRR